MDIIKENILNLNRIWSMAKLVVRDEFLGSKLGVLWEILRTGIYFTIYAVFYKFVRAGVNTDTEFVVLGLFSTLLPWNLVSTVINQTPRVYTRNKVLVNTIKFPLGIIPTFDIVAKYIIHLTTVAIILVIFAVLKHVSIAFVQVIYYYICLFILLLGLMFTLSLICSISKDAYKLWQVVTRVFIFVNPVFWHVGQLPEKLQQWVSLNPFVYIFEGFRRVMVGSGTTVGYGTIDLGLNALYFWLATLAILFLGILFQTKLRRVLPDVM